MKVIRTFASKLNPREHPRATMPVKRLLHFSFILEKRQKLTSNE